MNQLIDQWINKSINESPDRPERFNMAYVNKKNYYKVHVERLKQYQKNDHTVRQVHHGMS